MMCLSLGLLQLSPLQAQPVVIQLGTPSDQPFRGTTRIGLNLEMALTSDRMWDADDRWMARTFATAGVKTLRWGYSACWWDAFAEKPLTENYWSGDNTKDDAGTFGFKEFVAYCKETRTVPIIMLPVDALAAGVPMKRVLELSRRMTEYVAAQNLETTVYLEAGNEPYTKPKLPPKEYAEALRALYPLVKSIEPKFRVVAEVNEEIQPFITEPCRDFYDAVEWHHYLECGGKGKDPWVWYYQQDRDDLLNLIPKPAVIIPPGKEYLIGEINVLWPDWNGVMAGDRRSSLAYLNLLLAAIQDNRASQITPWPSHWPGLKGIPGYGWFRYDAFMKGNKTQTFPAVVGVHQLIQDYVLPVPVPAKSSDPKIRVFAYTSEDKQRRTLIFINKKPEAQTVQVPVPIGWTQQQLHYLNGKDPKDPEANYTPTESARIEKDSLAVILPAESATGVLLRP